MQIPAGWLVDRFEVKWVFAAGFFLWSAATAVTGVLHGFSAWVVIRVIVGIGESIAFPSYSKILGSGRFTESRRSFGNAAIMAGLALGPAVGMLVGGTVVGRFGWRPFFWCSAWRACCGSCRGWHGCRAAQLQLRSGRSIKSGFLRYFSRALGVGHLHGADLHQLRLVFPGGMVAVLSGAGPPPFDESDGEGWRVDLFPGGDFGDSGGKLSDRWIASGASATQVRKSIARRRNDWLGNFSGCGVRWHPTALLVWALAPAGICLGVDGAHCWAVTQTLAGPQVSGRWTGVQNFVGNFAGAFAPALPGTCWDARANSIGHF